MRGQYEELPCPFCDKGRIPCLYFPGAWSVKRKSTKTLPGRGTITRSSDIWMVQTGCSSCGKSQEEVEKELKRKGVI